MTVAAWARENLPRALRHRAYRYQKSLGAKLQQGDIKQVRTATAFPDADVIRSEHGIPAGRIPADEEALDGSFTWKDSDGHGPSHWSPYSKEALN